MFALKNVKIAEFASQETWCFEATLYLDDKRIGTVTNDGHGGANYYNFDHKEFERVSSLISGEEVFREFTIKRDLEIVVGELLERHQTIKRARRWQAKIAKEKGVDKSLVRVFMVRGEIEDQLSAVWDAKWTDEMMIEKTGGVRIDDWKVEVPAGGVEA
jgi:hypothetical protein